MFQDASTSSLIISGVESVDSASLWEDVEMTSDLAQELVQYIAVDTNVFLQRFGLVKALYEAFTLHGNGEIKLLIPTIVINELDGLTANHSPAPHNPKITVSEAARAGTHWLLETSRARTQAIRFQKWSERMDESLTKGDDRVLDCCLFFREKGEKGVVLWSDDRNLALLVCFPTSSIFAPWRSSLEERTDDQAEANEVRTIGGSNVTPKSVLDRLPLSVPDQLLDHLDKHPISLSEIGIKSADQDDMELDPDFADWTPPPPPIPMPITSLPPPSSYTNTPSQIDPFLFPFPSKRGTSPSKSSSPLSPPLASSIASLFVPFYDALPLPPSIIRRTWNPSSSPFEILKSILHALETLEKDQESQSARSNVVLLRTISAFRVLQASTDPRVASRRPRTGEVADALDELSTLVEKLGCACDKEELNRLSAAVRDL